MTISIIAALSKNRVIGINNDLPWHLPDDMKYFMQTTMNHVVIMGRKNYESIPEKSRPLPNRTNLILTRNLNFRAEDCTIISSLADGISLAKKRGENEVFIIGGGQVYQEAIRLADLMYLTEINTEIKNGEVFFPEFDDEWEAFSRVHHPTDDAHDFSFDFVKYNRKK